MMKNQKTRKSLKTATIMLAAVTTIVWMLMLAIKFFVSGMKPDELFDDIMSNILGILPPIIIFNFAYEYLTKDYMTDEISEEITQTLMSNPRALGAFDNDIKRNFIKSTISSLVGADKIDAVYGAIEPYLTYKHNIRSAFEYFIEIRNYNRNDREADEGGAAEFDPNLYYKIKEKISYRKVICDDVYRGNTFKVGFFTSLSTLDNELKNQNFIFRENLCIAPEEMQKLSKMTDEEKRKFVSEIMKLSVFINQAKASITSSTIDENGIFVEFKTAESLAERREIEMSIGFYMPQLKKNCEFLVSVTEPTYEPKINLVYDENTMNVRTYPFLNEESNLLERALQMPGEVSICPKGWIYPVKGVVFIVDQKQ